MFYVLVKFILLEYMHRIVEIIFRVNCRYTYSITTGYLLCDRITKISQKGTFTAMASSAADRSPTFCTLFHINNQQLTKDVGLIPFGMHKFAGYDAFIATHIIGDYPSLKYTPGLRIEEIPRKTGRYYLDSLLWLKDNAKRINVLNLYHTHKYTFRQALLYKFFNPRGKVYVKLDGWPLEYISKLMNYPVSLSRNPLIKFRNFTRYHTLFRLCRLVSTEFDENAAVLSKDFHIKVSCVPNPFNPEELHDFRPFSERSNTILFVGHVQAGKDSHILLDAFAKIAPQIPNWSLRLVGALKEESIASDFLAKYPELKERVIFTGEINDRSAVTEFYRDAKIFAFPSRYESFGIALTEAMINGCFAVTTDIPSSRNLTENFKYALGSKIDDIDGLAKNLLYACTHESEIESLAVQGRTAALERCSLERISRIIAEGLR